MNKKAIIILFVFAVLLTIVLGFENRKNKIALSFWGHNTTVLISDKLHNRYKISIFKNSQLCFFHFTRGDSISRYCVLNRLPDALKQYENESGVFNVNIDFPVLQIDTLYDSAAIPDMFFMDVNFDGEEEFVVKQHYGYNKAHYACFDLINGNEQSGCPALLEPMHDPFNHIVSSIDRSIRSCHTIFDRKKKEMYIYETDEKGGHIETWAKRFDGYDEKDFAIKVTKRVEFAIERRKTDKIFDTVEHTIIYELHNDTLKMVSDKRIKL